MVQVNDQRGIVEKLSVRATFVQMLDSTHVIVPNQDLLISPVTTFTGADRIWRIEVPVYVNYGYDIEEVRTILMDIAASYPHSVPEKPPRVFLVYVGDSGMRFKIWVWIDLTQVAGPEPAMDYIYTTASREFDERGIEVPRPELAVFHHDGDVSWEQSPALEEPSSERVAHSSTP
jgi:small-conductance mechanosensitive channel